MDAQEMRPPLASFANYMEAVLKENDHRGGWNTIEVDELFRRLEVQTQRLGKAMPIGQLYNIRKECADIANFAMMIYDRATAEPDGIVGVDV